MKLETIEARDKDGKLLGAREVDMPEDIDELRNEFDDKDIVKLALRSFVIDVQRELRSAATSKVDPMAAKLKQANPAQRAAIELRMRELGLL